MMYKFILIIGLLYSSLCFAEPWENHQDNIQDIEKNLYKFQQELDVLVERKKKTRDRARIEETLQRIVEIHSELITLRKELDTERKHINSEHPENAAILDGFDIKLTAKHKKKKNSFSPLDTKLDNLMIKIQLKFATFMKQEKKQEMIEVEKVVKVKKRKKKEREADVYLRRKSKVKLVK